MNPNFLFPYDRRFVVKTCQKRKEYGALERHRSNMKQECKKAPDREVRYVAFKSYHTKPPAPSVAAQSTKRTTKVTRQPSTIDQRAKSVKNPSKKPPVHHSASKLKGDNAEQVNLQEELGRIRQKEVELRDTLKTLQSENESLKQSLSACVPSTDHQQLQEQLRDALQKYADIKSNKEQLLEQNHALQKRVDKLTSKLEDVNCENAELQDRIELSVDRANYLEKKVEQLKEVEAEATSQLQKAQSQLEQTQSQLQQTQGQLQKAQSQLEQTQSQLQQTQGQLQQTQSQLQQTQSQVLEMTARSEQLLGANERLTLTLQNLQTVIDEQRLKMEDYATVKRKLRSTELEVQKVVDEKEVSSKFVELMESENTSMKQKNTTLLEQNAKLSKDLVDMKKKIEQLRQKFDDVNKENKLLKEKEARYLIHERINVSKYAKYPSTIPDRDDARASDLRSTSSSMFRLSHFPTATVPRRAQESNEFDVRLHHLLHRPNSVDRILKAKSRKH